VNIIKVNHVLKALKPSTVLVVSAVLFHMNIGLHMLVRYCTIHCLWWANCKGLAFYLQSTVSQRYLTNMHTVYRMGRRTYLYSAVGVGI
jgi:serine acetyltransferase